MRMGIALLSLLALAACATMLPRAAPSQEQFYARLRALCGHAYEGRLVSNDEVDREMAAARLVIQVRSCSDDRLTIPFHVGNDHGRVWIVSRTPAGLHLRHEHRRADGSEEPVSGYGGDAAGPGNPRRQAFPADQASRDLFLRRDAPASITNVWAIEIVPGRLLAYELRRPGRFFRAEFDLSRPAAAPPPPWGER
ncbi:MAG TPA: hypothetical protein VGW40_14100 [Allosphingosinicella sp.]|nr:hypothetical protein [Allosphingosinicella sp.]